MKKQSVFATVITLLAGSSLAYAADNPPQSPSQPQQPDNGRIVIAIQELGNRIEGLTKAGVKSVNDLAYQLDKSFTSAMQLNTDQTNIQNRTHDQTRLDADRMVKSNLQPFSSATLTYTNKSQPEVKKVMSESNARQNYITQLKNLEASDTIYSLVQGMDVSTYWTKKNIGAPGLNDDAFNFSALIEPEVYSPDQIKNSQNFIGYAARQYQSYTDGLNLSQLHNALLKYQQQGVKVLSQQIDQFRNNDAYKKYQMSVRSLTAAQSVATDIFAGLAAERRPMMTTEADPQLDAISRAIGVDPQVISAKNDNGETVTMYRYASPMQIANYRANYRLNDPKWYQEVSADSAENLQRKSVILLAEISRQLNQNHLDNEKIMSALAMLNLQSGELTKQMLATQVKDVNNAISTFANTANGNPPPQTTTSTSTSTTSPSTSSTTTTSSTTIDPNNYNTNTIPTTVPTTVPTQ